MMTSAVKVCSMKRKRGKRPSELEEVLLGHYIRLGPESHDSRAYLGAKRLWRGKRINRNFRIKSLLSQNWRGLCLHQNLERKTRELEASKIVSIKEPIA